MSDDSETAIRRTECPECGHPVDEWCDCPSCGWYDIEYWEEVLGGEAKQCP